MFAGPTWTLTLSETEDEVLGPVAHFSQTFVWVVLLSGLGVLVLSRTQIRRSLVPLAELREGTSRIAQRDFGSRVRVTSRDEFEELANAFNGMAVQLGRQFQALSTAAELDRAVLSATDVASIVDTLLARTRDVFPCHLVGVTLVAPDGGKSLSGVVYDYCDDARHSARVDLRSEDVQDLLDGPDLVAVDVPNGPHPAYLGPILRLGRAVGRWCSRSASSGSWSASWPSEIAAPKAPGRTSGCSSAGWPTRWRWRSPTRGCWSR